jgi:hypothetical protein
MPSTLSSGAGRLRRNSRNTELVEEATQATPWRGGLFSFFLVVWPMSVL